MRVYLIAALLGVVAGCSSDATQIVCSTASDCATGLTCTAGVCVPRATGSRGDTLDAGTTRDTGVGESEDATVAPDEGPTQLDLGSEETSTCTPSCAGRACGGDGCGGTCGTCAGDTTCSAAGQCVPTGGTGSDCGTIVACINACGADTTCGQACIEAGSASGQAQVNAILQCIQANCADAATEEEYAECQQSSCGDELRGCSGGGETGGTGTCADVYDCFLGCATDPSCADAECQTECGTECQMDATPAGAEAAVNLWNCGVDACASETTLDGFVSCTQTSCRGEAAECDAN